MRIWDVAPGYLSRQSLLGEHRELHAVFVILTERKTGYARHPETLRWTDALSGLAWRHAQLAAEMRLRGYTDRTPLPLRRIAVWPDTFVTAPHDQFELLRTKYAGAAAGRIPLPRGPHQLWAQHKYSVLARSPDLYRRLGRAISVVRSRESLRELSLTLTLVLRTAPTRGRLRDTLEHMWGHVAERATDEERRHVRVSPAALLSVTQAVAMRVGERYLCASTALGELGAYVTLP